MRATLQSRATALAVDVAKRDDAAGRVVNLNSLPVHTDRSAIAVGLATGETGKPVLSVYL